MKLTQTMQRSPESLERAIRGLESHLAEAQERLRVIPAELEEAIIASSYRQEELAGFWRDPNRPTGVCLCNPFGEQAMQLVVERSRLQNQVQAWEDYLGELRTRQAALDVPI